ncbi:MAG: hypothetical protein ACOCXP_02235 [Candidatus Dojkabacteria bacterium]
MTSKQGNNKNLFFYYLARMFYVVYFPISVMIPYLAYRGLREIKQSASLQGLILFMALYGGFAMSLKSIFGSFEQVFAVDLETVGLLVAIGMLARGLGKQYAKRVEGGSRNQSTMALLYGFFVGLSALAYTQNLAELAICSLAIGAFIYGVINVNTIVSINEEIQNETRASILSFESMMRRLASALVLFSYGFMLDVSNFGLIMAIFATILIFGYLIYTKLNSKFIE